MSLGFSRRALLQIASAGIVAATAVPRPALAADEGLERGDSFPDVVYLDPQKVQRSIGQLKGTTAIVYLWASWCPICASDLANIQRYYDLFKGNPKFSITVMNFLDSYETGLNWARQRRYTLPFSNSGMDSRSNPVAKTTAGSFTFPKYTPQFFILDAQGMVAEYTKKERNDGGDIVELLANLLGS